MNARYISRCTKLVLAIFNQNYQLGLNEVLGIFRILSRGTVVLHFLYRGTIVLHFLYLIFDFFLGQPHIDISIGVSWLPLGVWKIAISASAEFPGVFYYLVYWYTRSFTSVLLILFCHDQIVTLLVWYKKVCFSLILLSLHHGKFQLYSSLEFCLP